jgi:hypothetical protein
MEQTIYYCYEKETGKFAGSGTPFYDTETIGCTTEPCPEYEQDVNFPYWENNTWVLKDV